MKIPKKNMSSKFFMYRWKTYDICDYYLDRHLTRCTWHDMTHVWHKKTLSKKILKILIAHLIIYKENFLLFNNSAENRKLLQVKK